jgi:hypothetical protein
LLIDVGGMASVVLPGCDLPPEPPLPPFGIDVFPLVIELCPDFPPEPPLPLLEPDFPPFESEATQKPW